MDELKLRQTLDSLLKKGLITERWNNNLGEHEYTVTKKGWKRYTELSSIVSSGDTDK